MRAERLKKRKQFQRWIRRRYTSIDYYFLGFRSKSGSLISRLFRNSCYKLKLSDQTLKKNTYTTLNQPDPEHEWLIQRVGFFFIVLTICSSIRFDWCMCCKQYYVSVRFHCSSAMRNVIFIVWQMKQITQNWIETVTGRRKARGKGEFCCFFFICPHWHHIQTFRNQQFWYK